MLNRRLLRVKAMQSIYAYQRNRESDFEAAVESIQVAFASELRIIGYQNKRMVKEEEDWAIGRFRSLTNNGIGNQVRNFADYPSEKALNILKDNLQAYLAKLSQSKTRYASQMLRDVEKIYEKYLSVIQSIMDMAAYSATALINLEEKGRAAEKDYFLKKVLKDNPFLIYLKENQQLAKEINSYSVRTDFEQTKAWFGLLKRNEEFFETFFTNFSEEQTAFKEVILHIIKAFLFKNDTILAKFEEEDFNWVENKKILRGMLVKTFKSLSDNPEDQIELSVLSPNWEDDKDFFLRLFDHAIKEELSYQALLEEKSIKWTKDRIARLDHVLLGMAIVEMKAFPSIPVKVTINEYIEISKVYSTPKSWQYLNGMLDNIAKELEEKGEIRKSGRGLIDG